MGGNEAGRDGPRGGKVGARDGAGVAPNEGAGIRFLKGEKEYGAC